MKKKLVSILLCTSMVAVLAAGCGGGEGSDSTADSGNDTAQTEDSGDEAEDEAEDSSSEGGKTYAVITKSAGNPYNEKEASGFQEVIEAEGGVCIVKHPEAATADAQVSVIQSLISQGVDSICIAANDENALQASLEEAMEAGIKVSCLDSKTNPDSRQTFVNQAGTQEIGQALMDAVYDITGGEGQWAILSATSQAANQNSWIEAMKEIMDTDDKYADLELVEVAYGDRYPGAGSGRK